MKKIIPVFIYCALLTACSTQPSVDSQTQQTTEPTPDTEPVQSDVISPQQKALVWGFGEFAGYYSHLINICPLSPDREGIFSEWLAYVDALYVNTPLLTDYNHGKEIALVLGRDDVIESIKDPDGGVVSICNELADEAAEWLVEQE